MPGVPSGGAPRRGPPAAPGVSRAVCAGGWIDEAGGFNGGNGVTPGSIASVGSRLYGWYGEAGYDVLRLLSPGSEWNVVPYVRYERYDTQDEVPAGYAANPANDRTVVTAGAAMYPHPQVVVKLDQQWRSNEAETGQDQFNVAIGYLFRVRAPSGPPFPPSPCLPRPPAPPPPRPPPARTRRRSVWPHGPAATTAAQAPPARG